MRGRRSRWSQRAIIVASAVAVVAAGCTAANAPAEPSTAAEASSPTGSASADGSSAPADPDPAPVVDPWHRVPDLRTEPRAAWQGSIDTPTASWLFDTVIAVEDATGVTGYDSATGEERWQLPAPGLLCNATSVLITCASAAGELTTIDPATGDSTTAEVAGAFAGIAIAGDLVAWRKGEDGTIVERRRGDDVLWSHPSAVVEDTAITVINGIVLAAGGGDNGTGDALDAATGAPVHTDLRQADRLNQSRWLIFTESAVWEVAAGSPARSMDSSRGALIADSDPTQALPPAPSGEPLGPFARAGDVTVHSYPEHGPTTFTAREVSTGAELWVGPAIRFRDNLIWVDATTLAVTTAEPAGGGFVALDARTGETVWELAPETTIRRVLSDGDTLVIVSDDAVQSWHLGG